jgi:hypothetical protein
MLPINPIPLSPDKIIFKLIYVAYFEYIISYGVQHRVILLFYPLPKKPEHQFRLAFGPLALKRFLQRPLKIRNHLIYLLYVRSVYDFCRPCPGAHKKPCGE